jgi:HK97 family phage major capsid protein
MTSISKDLMEHRAVLLGEAEQVAQRAVNFGREMTATEETKFDELIAEAEKLKNRAAELDGGENRARELDDSFRRAGVGSRRGSQDSSGFGDWAREARIGDRFDLPAVPGAERRALERVVGVETRGQGGSAELRAMSASGGVGQDGVYGQLWQYAITNSQILQAGADVINTADGNTLPFPVATVHATTSDTPTAANAALATSDATLTTVNCTVSKYDYLTLVPTELVQDTTFDLEGYVARAAGRELGRRIAKVASAAAVSGYTTAGVTGPTGTATTFGNAATAGQGSDLFVNLYHSVLPDYRATGAWTMADPTLAASRNVKSATVGEPILVDPIMGGAPRILGAEVYIDQFLPSPGANAKTVYFGEWASLKVRIAGGIRFERSNDYAFGNDQIAFRAIVRCGAVVVDPNAVKYFAHSAT